MSIAMNLAANPLMQYAIDPLHAWLVSFGTLGMLVWVVLKILAITLPVIISVAFYVCLLYTSRCV